MIGFHTGFIDRQTGTQVRFCALSQDIKKISILNLPTMAISNDTAVPMKKFHSYV